MDIGGFRDMHRHRRCVQIMQDFTTAHGFDTPPEVEAAGIRADYESAMKRAEASRAEAFRRPAAGSRPQNAQYAIPLAFRKRTLFKMDFAEAALHLRIAHHARRTRLVSQRGLCHVRSRCREISGAGKVFPRARRARAGGPAEALTRSVKLTAMNLRL